MSEPVVTQEVQALAVKLMSEWVASIADRLKNPIAGIGAALDVLARAMPASAPGSLVDDALQRMRERLSGMNAYVSELVDFAKPAEIKPQRIDLEALARATLQEVEQVLTMAVATSVDVAVDARMVHADPGKLRIVLLALLENAAQAVPPERAPEIFLSLARVAGSAPPVVRLAVEDNGPGIEPKLAAQVFAPFFSTREAGTGLGLAIVRKYVEAHGGEVRIVRARRLGGARIEVDLPAPR